MTVFKRITVRPEQLSSIPFFRRTAVRTIPARRALESLSVAREKMQNVHGNNSAECRWRPLWPLGFSCVSSFGICGIHSLPFWPSSRFSLCCLFSFSGRAIGFVASFVTRLSHTAMLAWKLGASECFIQTPKKSRHSVVAYCQRSSSICTNTPIFYRAVILRCVRRTSAV